jgi:hypothetical protein
MAASSDGDGEEGIARVLALSFPFPPLVTMRGV